MTSQTNTLCILCITFLFATFHTVTSTSTPAAVLPPCASHPCENGGTCIEYTSAFQCRCTNDFTGLRCEIPVSNTASVCDDNPCAHGACVSSASDRFTCMCPGGWRGTACEIDVNECNGERGPNPCTNGTVCINEDGGYRCEAPCASPSPCQNGGTCSTKNTKPYYTCECLPNYEGETCDIVIERDDPCRSVANMCLNGGTCFSFGGAALCYCMPGFQGQHCEIDTDVCQTITCQNGGTCEKSRDQTASCICPPYYSGLQCDIFLLSPCDSLPCNASATCIEDLTLDSGFVCMSPCVKEPCQHGATCVHNQSTPLGFTCECTENYQGLLCENMIPPCSKEPCLNGATCQPDETASTGYQCLCDQGFEGLTCEVYVISPCSEDPCLNGGTCQPNDTASTGYQCLCDQGFEGPTCEIAVISPCTSNPCDNGGTCEAVGGALAEYNCICQKGYRGKQCEIVLHVCTFEGVTYQEGSERKEDCNMCHCQQGSWHCTDKFCGEFMVSFAFANTNSNENDDDEEEFSNTLKEDIAEYFDINVNMIQVLTVSGNPAQVQFQLQDTLDSEVDIENVAADMLRQFVTGTYAFHYNQASYSINSRTVVIERRDSDNHANNITHKDEGQQFISTTLLIVCIVVSTILVFAVLFGIAIIVVYKRRSRKEQIYCRKDKNTNASNNVAGGAIKYHKNVYNPVPPCPPARDVPVEVAEIRLQNGAGKHDVNINMEARV
ncbi:fibropellin-1-like isoform X2 [Lytechinus pictus]|uniref:fibropellin-1-like isoform X2 n=1 Tax=Lytechinus pictus TaxID=7653 RepID=UPI0030BA1690